MTLDDLLRDTLATRAHDAHDAHDADDADDADGVDLLAAVPAASSARGLSRRGRALAVTAVVAVAAVVVGVLVATLGPGSERANPVPAAPVSPPAGMQFVSYHGLTLTVPAAWPVGPFYCQPPLTDAVFAEGGGPPSCGAVMDPLPPPPGLTVVYLGWSSSVIDGAPNTTLAGRPALRSVQPDDTFPDEVVVVVQFADPTFSIAVKAPTEAQADAVLVTARSTPVDPRGCVENIDGGAVTGNPVSDRLVPGAPITVAVCQYEDAHYATGPQWLLGSRLLSDTETSDLVGHLSDAPAFTPIPDDGTVTTAGGLPVRYLFRFGDGSTRVIDVQIDGRAVVATDGTRRVDLGEFAWYPPSAFAN